MQTITDRNRHSRRNRRHHPPLPTEPGIAEGVWVTVVGEGSGFHDCPLCRELAMQAGESQGSEGSGAAGKIPAFICLNPESLPELARAGWLDDILDLVGPDAIVRLMGREMEPEPVEEISMEAFLTRLGYR